METIKLKKNLDRTLHDEMVKAFPSYAQFETLSAKHLNGLDTNARSLLRVTTYMLGPINFGIKNHRPSETELANAFENVVVLTITALNELNPALAQKWLDFICDPSDYTIREHEKPMLDLSLLKALTDFDQSLAILIVDMFLQHPNFAGRPTDVEASKASLAFRNLIHSIYEPTA